MVERGVGNLSLHGACVEVRIANLHRDAARQLGLRPHLERQPLHHPREDAFQQNNVDGVGLEGMLLTQRFLFLIRLHRRGVDAVSFLPNLDSVLSKRLTHNDIRNLSEVTDGCYSHRAQQMKRLRPYHRYLAYRQRVEERMHLLMRHLEFTVGFRLVGGDLRDGLVLGKSKRYWQSRVFHYRFTQLVRPFVTPEEPVHPGDVDIMFVDAGLLKDGRTVGDYRRHEARVSAVELHVTSDEHRLRTQLTRQPHGLRRMHAETSRLVAAGGDHAPVRYAADDHRTPLQRRVDQALHRHEKGVEIQM